MSFDLPRLPYDREALSPYISAETLDYHHGKHHRAYVNKLNALIAGTPFSTLSLVDIIKKSDGGIFNNAAQHWNHTFYWHCLQPKPNTHPTGPLAEAIQSQFGSLDQFKTDFFAAAAGFFGSGWIWLVRRASGELAITATANAGTPITAGDTPLLTCDVWEHAFYIDRRNDKAAYLNQFWTLVNWSFVARMWTGDYTEEESRLLTA